MICTIFKNAFPNPPYYITVDDALERIRTGRSKKRIEELRGTLDKDKQNQMKLNLPSICFSGKFPQSRQDSDLIQHSGFICVDFDNVGDLGSAFEDLINRDIIYACWVSPRGNGIKALIRIAHPDKHREHFEALKEDFPTMDKQCGNESRLCYESYDPNIYVYPDSVVYEKTKAIDQPTQNTTNGKDQTIFDGILKWLTNKNDAFREGERNIFIFKLASACCRCGMDQIACQSLIEDRFGYSTDFTKKEVERTIKSAYRSNVPQAGSATIHGGIVVDKSTAKELDPASDIFDKNIKPKDVIYAIDVKEEALLLHKDGYKKVYGIGVPQIDYLYKSKPGEVSLLSGIGNHGKTSWMKWNDIMRYVLYGEKVATFSPEDNPPEEFYLDYVEMLLGCDCTPSNPYQPPLSAFEAAYDFVSKGIFYIYPETLAPTPAYIKERFLEMIVKEGVSSVRIDPFNQLLNEYHKSSGRSDKYLETFLSDCLRFAQSNEVRFTIICHPHKLQKQGQNDYPMPDVFDLADGAMWNNKVDNILIYHRPFFSSEPDNPTCEFCSRKIRRQKTVGRKGQTAFEYSYRKRRFIFDGVDPLGDLIKAKGIDFGFTAFHSPDGRERWQSIERQQEQNNSDNVELPF